MRRRRFIILGKRDSQPRCYHLDCEFSKSGICQKPIEFECFYGREADDSFVDRWYDDQKELRED